MNRTITIKMVAGVLIIIMIGSLVLQSLISVSFLEVNAEGDSVDALSADFLQENFEYFTMPNYEKAQMYLLANATSRDSLEHHYAKASIALGDEEYYTALTEIRICMSLAGKDSVDYDELLTKEGCILAMLGKYEEATEVFSKVLELDDTNIEVLLLQTQLLLELGNAVKAMETLEAYLKLVEPNAAYSAIMTQLCYEAGDYEKAVLYGKEAMELDDSVLEDGEFLRFLGYSLLLGSGEAEEASLYLTQAIERLPDDAELYNYRGICNLALGKTEKALGDFDQTIQLGLTDASQYYNRGICYISEGEMELAKADMEQVIEIGEELELVAIAEGIVQELDGYTNEWKGEDI